MSTIKVAIVHRSYECSPSVSHAGLAICAINTCKTLNQHGIYAQVWPCESVEKLRHKLTFHPFFTHVVIQAPWIPTQQLLEIATEFKDIQFAVNCHSNVGFLQTEPNAVNKMLDLLQLEQVTSNIHCSGNSEPFSEWIEKAYQAPCTLLPNLYYVDRHAEYHRPLWNGGLLRIGIFGAPRPQKNMMTGVAGAIQIAQMFKAHTEIWVNRGRDETHGKGILQAAKNAIDRSPHCTYKEFSWASWPVFRRHISSMNLLIQSSYTESFNQVTADGVVTGVPTVVSPAIRWAPDHWKCDTDSTDSIAVVGSSLLRDPYAHRDGLTALSEHNEMGILKWKQYLKVA